MYRHILIATDGSELAGKAVTTGLSLGKQLNAKITAVTATEPFTALMAGEPALAFPVEDYDEAKKAGVACETVHAVNFPAEAIIDTANGKGCDLIVMSSHGRRGLARVLLGSQATRVVTLSTIPVLICR